MDTQQLKNIGLSEDQITLYNLLLQHGSAQAGRLSILSGLKRPQVYKVLQQLINLGLTDKDDESKIARFTPGHPSKLKSLLDSKMHELKKASTDLDTALDEMVSKYNLASGKPNVQFFEGERGLQKLYDDINRKKENILLFRSIYDKNHPYLAKMIDAQVVKQVRRGIHTKALTPQFPEGTILDKEHDEKKLIERRDLPRDKFTIPAQIIIYDNKVGITSYKKGLFTTIIDNQDISDTFRIIFDQLWDKHDDKKEPDA